MEDDSDDVQIYFFDVTKFTLCEMEDYDLSGEESENEMLEEESESLENEHRIAYDNAHHHMTSVFNLLVAYAEAVKIREEQF